jgi:polyhydroxyalkanoate synthesis regulator phasin
MHAGLRAKLGDEVADTMMEHLPPMGWAGVARRADVERIDGRIDHLERRIDGVIARLWALGSLSAAGFIGLFALIATKL